MLKMCDFGINFQFLAHLTLKHIFYKVNNHFYYVKSKKMLTKMFSCEIKNAQNM